MEIKSLTSLVVAIVAIGGGIAMRIWGPAELAEWGNALWGLGLGWLTQFGALGRTVQP